MTFFSDIDEYSAEFLSAAVAFELINSDHLGELQYWMLLKRRIAVDADIPYSYATDL